MKARGGSSAPPLDGKIIRGEAAQTRHRATHSTSLRAGSAIHLTHSIFLSRIWSLLNTSRMKLRAAALILVGLAPFTSAIAQTKPENTKADSPRLEKLADDFW